MSIPPYLTIAEAIRKTILEQPLPPHAKLPSEPELARRFKAARATIRRALASLQDEKLIYSRPAVGSFVAEPRVEQDLDQLFSFSEFMTYRGLIPGTRILVSETRTIRETDSPILEHLQLKPGARVVYLRRLRLGSGEPLVIANTWLPHVHFKDFLKHDLKRQSVYQVMAAMGKKPTDAEQTIESVTLGEEESQLLTVPTGSAAIQIRRVAYSRGLPVEYALDHYRGDRTTFRVRLGVIEQHLR